MSQDVSKKLVGWKIRSVEKIRLESQLTPAPGEGNAMQVLIVVLLVLTLFWRDNSFNEEAFVIEIRVGANASVWLEEAIVPVGTTSYPLTFYSTRRHCYRIRAYNAVGESNPTNVVCHTPKTEDL